MVKEDKVPAIYGALARVSAALAEAGLGKGQWNEQQRYWFRGIDDLYNLTGKLFAEHKIITLPIGIQSTRSEYATDRGKKMMNVVTTNKYRILSLEDGSFVDAEMSGEGSDNSDKATNKANSGAHKYLLLQTFNVPLEGNQQDREGDFTTEARVESPPPASQPARVARRPQAQVEPQDDMLPDPVDPALLTRAVRRPQAVAEHIDEPSPHVEDTGSYEEQYDNSVPEDGVTECAIETALRETVVNEVSREKVRGKILEAYGVMLLDQIPADREQEAIDKLKKYWETTQAKIKGKARRA